MLINVVPKPYATEIKNVTSITFDIYEFIPFKQIVFNVVLFSNREPIDIRKISLEGDDYAQWGDNDEYIINFIISNLGLEVAPIVEPVIEPAIYPVIEPVIYPVIEPVIYPVIETVIET